MQHEADRHPTISIINFRRYVLPVSRAFELACIGTQAPNVRREDFAHLQRIMNGWMDNALPTDEKTARTLCLELCIY